MAHTNHSGGNGSVMNVGAGFLDELTDVARSRAVDRFGLLANTPAFVLLNDLGDGYVAGFTDAFTELDVDVLDSLTGSSEKTRMLLQYLLHRTPPVTGSLGVASPSAWKAG